MNFRLLSLIGGTLLSVGTLAAASMELCPGGSMVANPSAGVTITSSDGFACKSMGYNTPSPGGTVYGLGTNAGTVGEIDPGQMITFTFDQSVNLEAFEIIVFYNGPEFGDPSEEGKLSVVYGDGSTDSFTFRAQDQPSTTGIIWSGLGTANNISPMTEDNAGWFEFVGFPLGGKTVKSLTFTSIDHANGTNNSDYAIKSLLFTVGNTEVPEPSTYALMGLGLLGFATMRRYRKN